MSQSDMAPAHDKAAGAAGQFDAASPATKGPLWTPDARRIASARRSAFVARLAELGHTGLDAPASLYSFSLEHMVEFWAAFWAFAEVVGERGETILDNASDLLAARFFPEARLNFAENLLRWDGPEPALIFRGEGGRGCVRSRQELRAEVGRLTAALSDWGVRPGDRVCGWLPNLPEAVIGHLAAASLGAVWASASPDFGVEGVVDRFGQIEPKVLLAADGYLYAGKRFETLSRLAEIRRRLPSVERVIVVPYLEPAPDLRPIADARLWEEALAPHLGASLRFERLAFDHPLAVLFSSGTTGKPKCILHRAGGVLLQHLKEHQLHCDVRPGDRVFYSTTTGWMMWNWLVSALASGAAIVLYDGSPLHPEPGVLFDLAEKAGVTLFGTSARYLESVAKLGLVPRETHRLAELRTVTSTGSPLSSDGFEYVYRAVKGDVHLASISGGTDLCACFVGGDPTGPVWSGEIQGPCLGMAVDVFDGAGRSLAGCFGAEARGELVCRRPFPSQPLGFWRDPAGLRYRAAYYERFPGAWHHGDLIEPTVHGGYIIHGRSDATLNPGGVRIGTAEIYRLVERVEEVLESLAVTQRWEGDERIVLFVRLRPGVELDAALAERIRRSVREGASPRHVPARIVRVEDLPRTRSGKLVELAVREVLHGRPVANLEAIANPEALRLFADLPELAR